MTVSRDSSDVMPGRYPENMRMIVLIGSESACMGFWKERVRSNKLPAGWATRPYASVQQVSDLRIIDPLLIVEILLMTDFKHLSEYTAFCEELSQLDSMYQIPIRSGEAMST